jgi:hypothetical protein
MERAVLVGAVALRRHEEVPGVLAHRLEHRSAADPFSLQLRFDHAPARGIEILCVVAQFDPGTTR